jgi:hypothetical protein
LRRFAGRRFRPLKKGRKLPITQEHRHSGDTDAPSVYPRFLATVDRAS